MATFAVMAVALTACLPASSAWQGSGLRVGVVGDSEIYQLEHDVVHDAEQHLTDALVTAGYRVSTSDAVGAGTYDLDLFRRSSTAAGWPAPGPQIAVIALGTNDVATKSGSIGTPFGTAVSNYLAYLDAVRAAGSACDVLIEVPETTPWGLDQYGPLWNAFVALEAAGRHGVLVNWADTLKEHPEYVGSDGVHQTSAGKVAYMSAIVAAVDQCRSQIQS